jgi:D-beta-D-heptose 7-phosphate kinase/D-beta-D-heptose 1-phosphate adenosyltransferase
VNTRLALAELIDRLKNGRVLSVGDVLLDRYVYGEVERISPEAPIPILGIRRRSTMLGGTGNVVRNLASLGVKVILVGVVGNDDAGKEVTALLGELPTVTPRLLTDPSRPTSIKTRFLAGTQQLMRADEESTASLDAALRARLIETAEAAMKDVDVVVLSDYGKGVLRGGAAAALIQAAAKLKKPVIVDPKGRDFSLYRGASLITPNRQELAEATGMPVNDSQAIVAAAKSLIDGQGIAAVLATRSRDGMTLLSGQASPVHLAAEAREVFDVAGAGDTVVATVAAGLAAGASLADAAALANAAAGIVVGKVGTAAVYPDELHAALHHQDLTRAEAKVLPLDQVLDRVGLWRRSGLKVGFTNGCFDLLHPGHIHLLTQARAACDRLIVGLNSDSSVKGLKGETRPVQNEAARATVLASLACVDAVVVYGDDIPLRLIDAIRPDLLVKGADWSIDKVVGADVVQNSGGRVLLVDLAEGHSTTNTIAKMAR